LLPTALEPPVELHNGFNIKFSIAAAIPYQSLSVRLPVIGVSTTDPRIIIRSATTADRIMVTMAYVELLLSLKRNLAVPLSSI
jgi:hypothetical protein